ncbi:acetyltransferase [Methylomonas koyamae]|uniref:Acetyltransferase n=1 Tax=Methylomonas koyamae TaxID=702114 RepID=A0A177N7X7_9GAMM|nr:GNAT family N-acetyltransferase [Methylomonas koyamae]OAI13972.1 acetyltransferase [Methylomonas koyamae]
MKPFAVRQAMLADLEALVPLFDGYRRFYGKSSDPNAAKSFLRDRFEHGESVLFLAEQGSRIAGFVQLYPSFSSVSLARTYILNDLFVDTGFRRQGIAGRLMAAAVEYATSLGAVRLTLSTAAINTEAQALYRTTGWARDEQFYVYHLPIPAIEPLND